MPRKTLEILARSRAMRSLVAMVAGTPDLACAFPARLVRSRVRGGGSIAAGGEGMPRRAVCSTPRGSLARAIVRSPG